MAICTPSADSRPFHAKTAETSAAAGFFGNTSLPKPLN
ncbi:hypothetical protein NNO_0108 [Hydrogenimonas sp.]|nr:hypothetical protein NNO_0108 [Hydrogenimonas sp.]